MVLLKELISGFLLVSGLRTVECYEKVGGACETGSIVGTLGCCSATDICDCVPGGHPVALIWHATHCPKGLKCETDKNTSSTKCK